MNVDDPKTSVRDDEDQPAPAPQPTTAGATGLPTYTDLQAGIAALQEQLRRMSASEPMDVAPPILPAGNGQPALSLDNQPAPADPNPAGGPAIPGNGSDALVMGAKVEVGSNWRSYVGNFSGDSETNRDIMEYLRRFETTILSHAWENGPACANFMSTLRGGAQSWAYLHRDDHPNKSRNWLELKAAFLKRYSRERANTTIDWSKEFVQRKSEGIRDFSDRIRYTLRNSMDIQWMETDNMTPEQKLSLEKARDFVERTHEQYFIHGMLNEIRVKCDAIPTFHSKNIVEKIKDAASIETQSGLHPVDRKLRNKTVSAATTEDTNDATKSKKSRKPKEEETETSEIDAMVAEFRKKLERERKGKSSGNFGNYNRGRGGAAPTHGSRGNNFRGGYRGNNRGNNNYRNGNNEGPLKRRVLCHKCQKWGYHYARKCPVPNHALNLLTMDDPNYDEGLTHPYEEESTESLNE